MDVSINRQSSAIPPWLVPMAVLGVLASSSTLIFWLSDVDLRCAALFYAPPPALNPWPQELKPLWLFFYYGVPIFAALMALGTGAVLLIANDQPRLRRSALYVLLTLALGPGLLVNLVFKDHIGRPRPRQLEVFGGHFQYLPPLALGVSSEEKSFPAGHSSLGFSLCSFWFLWRRRRPRLAWMALSFSLILGLTLGLGRMAAGAHFLSDVFWAGFISFFTALTLYYFILRIPEYELLDRYDMADKSVVDKNSLYSNPVFHISIGLVVLLGAILGFPIYKTIDYNPSENISYPAVTLKLDIHYANLIIHLVKTNTPPVHIFGEIRGFGFPTYQIDSYGYLDQQTKTLNYVLMQRGFFTEMDANLHAMIAIAHVKNLIVELENGNIQLIADKDVVLPKLELKTNKGHITPLIRR